MSIGHVLKTTPGELAHTHGVRTIMHVAAVQGGVGTGTAVFESEKLEECVENVLMQIDHCNAMLEKKKGYRSVLIPMLGAGQGGGTVEDISRRIAKQALDFLEAKRELESRSTRTLGWLREIYLSAYSDRVESTLREHLDKMCGEGKLERITL